MSAATPGPWRLEQTAYLCVVADGHLGVLAELRSRLDYAGMHPLVAQTREANARLISSAPELLAALIKARACIKKARDELHDCHFKPHTGGVDALCQMALEEDDELLAVIDAAIQKATGDAP